MGDAMYVFLDMDLESGIKQYVPDLKLIPEISIPDLLPDPFGGGRNVK